MSSKFLEFYFGSFRWAPVIAWLLAASPAGAVESTIHFSNQAGFDAIRFQSQFYGYQSAVDRDYTSGQLAYDYSVHITKDASRYRMYAGGRWRSALGDGDHVLQWVSNTGAGGTWAMPHSRPEFWQGQEDGYPNTWFSDNYIEPEVVKVDGTYYMYTQVQINPGRPIDIPGQTAVTQADRIQLHTSTDGNNWTRWSTERGVVVNIDDPTITSLHHQEVIYVPWDSSGKPWWMYVGVHINGASKGYYRIRSSDPTTFDWQSRETGIPFSQFGNQTAYASQAPGGPLFVRITFVTDATGRKVPSLQFSRSGLRVWFWGDDGPIKLDGSQDNSKNKNCYFLGISTIDGTGELEYLGNNTYRAIYGATTSNSPVAPDIFYSEIGAGELTFQLLDTTAPTGGISINGGTVYTNSRSVMLALTSTDSGFGVSQMRFSSDGTNWGTWESYSVTKVWTLPEGDGTKWVYVQFQDAAGNVSQTYSDSIILDTTPPMAPASPTDDGAYTSATNITFNWTGASDTTSGIQGYNCQIGTAPGGSDVFDGWVGDVSSKTAAGSFGKRYFCRVQAKDWAGNISGWSQSSDGITIAENTGIGIASARQLADAASVGLASKVVTAVFFDCFYIEEASREAGIKVKPIAGIPSGLAPGNIIDVGGLMRTDSSFERWIDATVSIVSGDGSS
ncbi:MAG: hypothetical protein HYX78_11980 [Armatimonadetes bacterium]|nr:hypothetical protein [Armatimonadota bacterium]